MARCMTSERHGRPVFYGAMITEGIVALIWAAAATYFYREHGMEENNASVIVDAITKDWLGAVGGVLAILGVIAAPITSGDTAFRSARLIVADFLKLEQKSMRRRLYICVPMFIVAIGLLLYSLRDKDGFDMIWRYFAWANQTLRSLLSGHYGLLGTCPQVVWFDIGSRSVYDSCLFHLYLHRPRRIRIVTLGFVCDRRGLYTDWSRLVYCLEKRDWILV